MLVNTMVPFSMGAAMRWFFQGRRQQRTSRQRTTLEACVYTPPVFLMS